MDYIYTEEDIIKIIEKFRLFNYRISPYMYLIGVNQKYLFGNISIISNELICMIHFNAGSRRLFKKYKYNEEEFKADIEWAINGMFAKENYRVNKTIDALLK